MTEKYDSTEDTLKHIGSVRSKLHYFANRLLGRGIVHDQSKLNSPEKEVFDRVTPKLRGLTYGSHEYKESLAEMGEALLHHYQNNSHHPEHYPNGIEGMDLLDLLEMYCDWLAATERHQDGDMEKSIEINANRFGMDPQVVSIFQNTFRRIGSETTKDKNHIVVLNSIWPCLMYIRRPGTEGFELGWQMDNNGRTYKIGNEEMMAIIELLETRWKNGKTEKA